MKRCSSCKLTKPTSDFYRNRSAADGLQFVCKDCSRTKNLSWQSRNKDKVRALGRKNKRSERERKGAERTQEEWRAWYATNAENRREYQRERFDPIKDKAQNIVYGAIKSGKLTRPSICERCGNNCKPDAHHSDYSKPLEVEWLCRRCHRLLQNPKAAGYLQAPPPKEEPSPAETD